MTASQPAAVMINGATGMLGAATAAELAGRGINTVLVARDRTRGTASVQGVVATLLAEGVFVCVLGCLVRGGVGFGVRSGLGRRWSRPQRGSVCR